MSYLAATLGVTVNEYVVVAALSVIEPTGRRRAAGGGRRDRLRFT